MVRVGQVWDRTMAFVGERKGAVLPIAIGTLVLPDTISAALLTLGLSAGAGARLGIATVLFVLGLVGLWGRLAITSLVLESVTPRGALHDGGRRIPAMIAVALVLMLVAMAAVFFFILTLAPFLFAAMRSGGASMNLEGLRLLLAGQRPGQISVGAVLFGLVLLWLTARLSVLMPVVVAERRGLGAIGRAFALTRGLALKMAGVILLYVVVIWIVTYATQAVFGTVLMLVAGGGEGPVTVAGVLTGLAVSVVSAIFTVLSTVFLAQLYRAVRAAREGAPAA